MESEDNINENNINENNINENNNNNIDNLKSDNNFNNDIIILIFEIIFEIQNKDLINYLIIFYMKMIF